MRRLLLAALHWAMPALAEPLKVVIPNFTPVGVPPEKAKFFTEHLAGRLAEVGAAVTTPRSLEQLLGLERQRQLIGCSESSSCLAELASALGTDTMVVGDLAKLENEYQLNLKLVSGRDAKIIAAYQARVKSESALLDELDKASFGLVDAGATLFGRDQARPLKAKTSGSTVAGFVTGGVALAAGIGATALLLAARGAYASIPQNAGDPPVSTADATAAASNGKSLQTGGFICLGVGVAAVAASATFWALGARSPVTATIVGGNGSTTLVVGGTF